MNPFRGLFNAPTPLSESGQHGVAVGSGPIGNPMYDIAPGHEAAILAVLLLPIVAWWIGIRATDGSRRATILRDGYANLAPLDQLAVWAMAASAAIHLALAPGHGGGGIPALFVLQAGLLGLVIWRAVSGRPWRRLGGAVLAGSVLAYAVVLFGGEAPDQVGLATKLIEVVGLAAIARAAARGRRFRSIGASLVVVGLLFGTSIAGWVSAFAVAGGTATGHGHGQGHDAGAVPPPGSTIPSGLADEATPEEVEAAAAVHAAVAETLARYADPRVAATDGYDTAGIHGTDFHASNPTYEEDGRILDPERPENLVYAATSRGPLLLGAMFTVPVGTPGPMVGGPLTVWHAHEQVCVGLLPPGLTGVLSPLGGCPVGSLDFPMTNEMIHVWTVPGAPQQWGDLDEAWRAAYLSEVEARP